MRTTTLRSDPDARPLAMMATLIAASLGGGCLGAGHVYRAVEAEAVVDLDCPAEKVEVEGLDAMHERFRASGCDREARYDWVDGRAVRVGATRGTPAPAPAPSASSK